MFEGSFIRLLLLDGRGIASCIYCSGIFDLKEAVRNGWYKLLLGILILGLWNRGFDVSLAAQNRVS
jgi:hypothetical protein